MKKILIILTLSLLTSSNLFAAEFNNQNKFNKWLLENGHSQYLKDGGAKVDLCATFKKIVMLGYMKNVGIILKEKW